MLIISFLLLFVISVESVKIGSLHMCPKEWKEYKVINSSQFKCIKPFYEMVGRDEAQRRCRQMGNGFDLIEIHSMYENDIIVFTLAERVFTLNDSNDDMFNHFRPQVWIGPKRVPFGGIKDFQYRSGCGIKDFDFWHKGQPNDHFNNEDCVYMLIDDYFMGQWADYNCNTQMYYVCQYVTDLKPPCNQTNYNLFGYNETNPFPNIKNSQNSKHPKKNITQTSRDWYHNWYHIIPNPFDIINRFISSIRKNLKI